MKPSYAWWLVVAVMGASSCVASGGEPGEVSAGDDGVDEAALACTWKRPARNVVVMIVDGMALPQIAFLTQHRRLRTPDAPPNAFERLLAGPYRGLADTYMVTPDGQRTLVVDSAASATQIACGVMSLPQVTGLDQYGYPCETSLERARSLGMATGLVTDARITHATPGAFVAKQVSRSAENEIALEYVSGAAAGKVDVLLGGGARQFIPTTMRVKDLPECAGLPAALDGAGQRKDGRNVIDEARAAGYDFVCNDAQLAALPEQPGTRVLGTFGAIQFPNYPERATVPGLPSLEAVTRKAVRLLERDPDGFYLVVEAGLVDYAAHEHDGAYLLRSMQEAERIVAFLLDYVAAHPGTLLVVLGDHETSGPGFSYMSAPPVTTTLPSGLVHTATFDFASADEKYALLERQTLSLGGMVNPIVAKLWVGGQPNPAYSLEQGVADLIAVVEAHSDFTLSEAEARWVLSVPPTSTVPWDGLADRFYQDSPFQDRLARALVDQTQLLWTSGHHTSQPVMVFAAGPRSLARRVNGYQHTTDIGLVLFEALGGR